ncbi:pilus assembly protein TadG-related protein [Cytobacillus sp. FJAT-53684]|uniref:Pilus assembly protein TadG-related protein n=1 Tax=Cytobacillus mangrovibacter TaxID=3299024 RepID=A0ABW6K305_9BACI
MKQYIKNERGSGVILTIFSFAIVGIMLILVLNIAMVFTKKEQASIAAEHASLAATSVVYEKVDYVIQSHVKKVIIGIDENGVEILEFEPLIEKVTDMESAILSANASLSSNEAHIQAVNQVLLSEIPDDEELPAKITAALYSAKSSIPYVVKHIIEENFGKGTDYEWNFLRDENRIEVIAKTEFNVINHNGLQFGSNSDIPQKGKGPSISFVESSGW